MINVEKIKDLKAVKLLTKKGEIYKKNFEERKKEKKDKWIEGILKDLQENHNHSWYDELFLRNKDNLDDKALFYRGNEITYGQMFKKMQDYAKSLKSLGIKENSEIPICISNTPEFVYLLGAISMLGAKANVFASDYDAAYLVDIINSCNSDIIFVEDRYYNDLKNILPKTKVNKIIMPSLTTSLPKEGNKFAEIDKKHGLFVNKVPEFKKENEKIESIDEFLRLGKNYDGTLDYKSNLDTEFIISYSSGTTSNRPKPIVHTTRSLVTIGRCHDPEVQKTTSMKDFTIQAHIPTFSNTDIICSISDSLMQGSKLALEPIYDKDFFLDTLLINKPTYIVATRSHWLNAFKKIYADPKYQNVKMPFLFIPFAVGEPLEVNEEKFLNQILSKVKAGKDKIPLPASIVKMSIAGGDCEHGGIFWLLFRAWQSKKPNSLLKQEPAGLKAFEMVEYDVLDEKGNSCAPYQYGRLVANSPCTMKCYKDNPLATDKFFIKDATGKEWGDCSVYSYLDKDRGIHIKGRIPKENEEVPSFIVADAILKDTKNILSCEVVKSPDGSYFIAHVEKQPTSQKSMYEIIYSAEKRCQQLLGKDITSKILYRIHNNKEGFPLTHSGKRDTTALEREGISINTFKLTPNGNETLYLSGKDYIDSLKEEKPKVKQKV